MAAMSATIENFRPHPEIACSKEDFDPAIHKAVYKFNYPLIFKQLTNESTEVKIKTYRKLIQNDRFAIVHFVMGIAKANHPFVVNMCKTCEDGPDTKTLDIWAREHFKSVIITIAGTVQRIVNDPDSTTCIFSYKKPAAEKFLESIKKILEMPFMYDCFPEILYDKKPESGWSLQSGITVKRPNDNRKEHTVEASGLIEGQMTGAHFRHRIVDDCETADLAQNPDQLQICFERFEMSRNLGEDGGTEQIIGTYYSHQGMLVKLRDKKDIYGDPMYIVRIIPATDDGTITGKPVLFSQEYLDDKKMDGTFNSQQLCDPTPGHDVKLKYEHFKEIPRSALPQNRVKFVIIDPAGDKEVITGRNSDNWAMLTVSISPNKDDLGFSDVFIEDGIVSTFDFPVAINAACALYRRSGRVSLLAIEQVGQSSQYRNIMDNLKTDYGVYLEIKKKNQHGGNLLLLTPKSKGKNYRIASVISTPLINGKLHIVEDLEIKGLLKAECEKFPFFHVDILDALAYLYDILADPTTPMIRTHYEGIKPGAVEPSRYSAMCA